MMDESNKILAGSLLLTGTIFFPASFMLFQHLWFNTKAGVLLKNRCSLSDKECTDISVKIVSAIQAILASISGMIVCVECYGNVLYDKHPLTLVYAWFGIPYFVYDTFAMFYASRISCKKVEDSWIVMDFFKFIFRSPIIVIHHMILAPIGFTLLICSRDGVRNGDFFMGIVYLMEISTPFVSMRFILSKMKMKSSFLYTLNGITMLIIFPMFRIFSTFFGVLVYAEQNGMGFFKALWDIPWGWKIVFVAAITPQMYWYTLMCKGLIKILCPPPPTPTSAKPKVKNGAIGPDGDYLHIN